MEQDGGLAETKWNAADVQRLYQQHGAALVAYARSFLPDAAAAEDVVHSVFVKLLRGSTARPALEAGYLYRAVKNAALNTKRDVARETAILDEERWFVHRGGDAEAELTLQKALGELPEEQREVVMMTSAGRCARKFGVPTRTDQDTESAVAERHSQFRKGKRRTRGNPNSAGKGNKGSERPISVRFSLT